jgi:dipeptidase E
VRLFLYSCYLLAPRHRAALARLVGKEPGAVTYAAITNALDVEESAEEWLGQTLASLGDASQVEVVDLRQHRGDDLRARLGGKDVVWLCGGNGFYLRWLLRESGADEAIRPLVAEGTVYAGWSAGAVLAGPTLRHFELVEDLTAVPEVVDPGLGLTELVVLPHMDLDEFAGGMRRVGERLRPEGFRTVELTDAQALVVDGARRLLLDGDQERDL